MADTKAKRHAEHSPSFERNKQPILEVLRRVIPPSSQVLEIGSGTGQHAAYFAAQLSQVQWQPTDLRENLDSIGAWRDQAGVTSVAEPLVLDLFSDDWPVARADVIVCINTIHIVSWRGVKRLFIGAGRLLPKGGILYAYGPYRYRHRPLEPSNEQFDLWLKNRDPNSGVREFESVDALAQDNGLVHVGDIAMPANNRSLWWCKT